MEQAIAILKDNVSWVYYGLMVVGVGIAIYRFIITQIRQSKLNLFVSLITEVPATIKSIEAHQKLMYSEIKLQGKIVSAILDTLDLAHFLCDTDGKCIKVNSKWIAITGLPESDALGHNWLLSVHIEDREHVQEKWQAMVDHNSPFEEIFRYQNRITQTITTVKCHATDVLDEQGARVYILGFSRVLN